MLLLKAMQGEFGAAGDVDFMRLCVKRGSDKRQKMNGSTCERHDENSERRERA